MEKINYKLGISELYYAAITETKIESTPAFTVTLKEPINSERLRSACSQALPLFPLFAATLEYKGEYSLVGHESEPPIIASPFEERAQYFGKSTGGYLFRICVDGRKMLFEWSRILTDEYGARDFLLAILSLYFGESASAPVGDALQVYLETLTENREKTSLQTSKSTDKNEKKTEEKRDYSRIKSAGIPTRKNPRGARVHTLSVPVSELCAASGRESASPESVLIPIFANVLHRRARSDEANITADVTLNCRNADIDSMHNLTVTKTLTYSGLFGKTEVKRVMELYEQMLESAKNSDSIKKEAMRTAEDLTPLVTLRPRFLRDLVSLAVSKAVVQERNDFSFVNLGTVRLSDTVREQIEEISILSAPSTTDATISLLEISGELIITVSENYIDEGIISDFIGICARLGINISEKSRTEFTSSCLKIK